MLKLSQTHKIQLSQYPIVAALLLPLYHLALQVRRGPLQRRRGQFRRREEQQRAGHCSHGFGLGSEQVVVVE